MRPRFFTRIRLVLIVFIGLLALIHLLNPAAAATKSPSARDAIQAAWDKARLAGSYHFNATVVQTTIPKPLIANVGVSSREERLYLQGEADQATRSLAMDVWSDNGGLNPTAGNIAVRVEGDRVLARRGEGPWEEIDNFSSSFAPQGDWLSFLIAADGVELAGTETAMLPGPAGQETSLTYSRYTFHLDGPRMAEYVREQMQQAYNKGGELPPGIELDLPRTYAEMTGEGELWVSTEGLPLRQILNLHYPEQQDSRVETEATTDFDFAPGAASLEDSRSGLLGLLGDLQWPSLPQVAVSAVWFVLAGALLSWMVGQSVRRRQFYPALAILILVCMLLNPLLQDFQLAAFAEQMTQRAEAAEERQQEGSMAGAAGVLQPLNVSPHVPRMAVAMAGSGVQNCQNGDSSDLDEDGLNGCEEAVLGTNPEDADSDRDMIPDGVEVAGFQFGGQSWYPDPTQADTNGDGRGDGAEWDPNGDPAEWDLDLDGTPNLFDLDDDGDGVPDLEDVSPERSATGPFTPDDPFSLIIEGLTPGEPTLVQFQLRPADAAHLGYAMNVVDWPLDRSAQLQDDDQRTWADQYPNLPLVPNSFGDLRLVPALEIHIIGPQTNLPGPAELKRYGLSVMDMQDDGSEKIVYVPLLLDTDPIGQGRVSLSGKMFYRPDESWGNAQEVRLIWMVQALNDRCETFEDGSCSAYSAHNQLQVMQIYYDSWTLTGLSVREDQGADFAMIYEDPAVDPEPDREGALFALAHGLDNSFLAGRDQDDDGQLDITTDELYRRFNHATNGGVSEDERWGISNTLSVRLGSYEYLEEALATIPMTDTKDLLEGAFGSPPSAPITPTIMFAQQERFRATSLDQDNTLSWSGHRLTVQMVLPGGDSLPLYTRVGARWAPFFYDRTAGAWASYPIEDYWEDMISRYSFNLSDPEEAKGVMQAARFYYLAMYRGPSVVVQEDDTVLESAFSRDFELRGTYKAYIMGGIGGLAAFGAAIWMIYKAFTVGREFFRGLGSTVKSGVLDFLGVEDFIHKWPSLRWSNWGKTIVITAVIIVLALLVAATIAGAIGGDWSLTITIVQGIVYTLALIYNIIGLVQVAVRQGSFLKNFKALFWTKGSVIFSTVLTVIAIAAIWIVFFKDCSNLSGVAYGAAMAYAIAATIWALVLLLVSILIPGGAVLVALLALVDFILWLCGKEMISEKIMTEIASWFFGFDVMVSLNPAIGNQDMTYGDRRAGLTAGNTLLMAADITTTLTRFEPKDWRVREVGLGNYTEDNQRSASVDYAFRLGDPDYPPAFSVDESSTYWNDFACVPGSGGGQACTGWSRMRRELPSPITLTAGVNVLLPIYFHTTFDLPAVECWDVPLLSLFWDAVIFCNYERAMDDITTDPDYRMDIFPATLDEFFAMDWDPALQAPHDVDGDGLVSAAYGGADPDDTRWDTDGDGLADGYELELRQNGTNISAQIVDSDGDGLSDLDEVRYGSDPGLADTDGDGLSDRQEVDGWTLTITTLSNTVPIDTLAVHVTSDPAKFDTDGDGMSDMAEKSLHELAPTVYALNPRVANPSPVAFYAGIDDEDAVVAPGTTLLYTATVANNLAEGLNLYAVGDLDVTFTPPVQPGQLHSDFSLFSGQAITVVSPVYVPPDMNSQYVPINNVVDADLANNPECATLWFDYLFCGGQVDDEDWWIPWHTTSEIYLRVNGQQVWSNSVVDDGGTYWINGGPQACGLATVELWEDDADVDDLLASWTVSMTNVGTFVQPINATGFWGNMNYQVLNTAYGGIHFEETIPLLVDDDLPSSALTSLQPNQYIAHVPGQDVLVVGGVAHDPTSRVALVEVSVDGGPWDAALGSESWAYTWTLPVQAGWHTLRTRATDVVGHVYTETADIPVIVDIDSPDIDTPIVGGTTLVARQNERGRWSIPLYGTVIDTVGSGLTDPPGSGVAWLEVMLVGGDDVAGQGWQRATLTDNGNGWDWTIDYLLPELDNEGEARPNPTGNYMLLFRARDNVGLLTPAGVYPGIAIRIDNTAPVATITDAGPWPVLITDPIQITGVITDPGVVARGLDNLQISYTPGEVAGELGDVLRDLLLLLHLDEPAGTTEWDDSAGNALAGCSGPDCPIAGVAGPSGSAVDLDGIDDRLFAPEAKLTSRSFTVALWARYEGVGGDGALLFQGEGGQGLAMNIVGRVPTCEFGGSLLASPIAADTAWHYWSCTYDAATRMRTIYYDGMPVASDTPPTPYQGHGPLYVGSNPALGYYLDGQIDEVAVWDRALSADEMQAVYRTPGLIWHWQQAALAQSGPGVVETTWTHDAPDGIEGIYRLDLRGEDVLGNRSTIRTNWPQWQGEIDTLAPRVDAGYAPYGSGLVARTAYTCTVEDMNLDESTWQCPCLVRPEDRTYYDSEWWQTWFTATERLYRIESSCIVPGYHAEPPTVGACDRFGHCASWTPPRLTELPTDPTFDSVVLTPTYGAVFTTLTPLQVGGMAFAEHQLKTLNVTANGVAIYTENWVPGTSGDAWSTIWTPPGEGVYVLVSVLEDQFGFTQPELHPVTITVDTTAPEILVAPDVFTSAQSLGPGWVVLTGIYTEAGAVDAISVETPFFLSEYLRDRLAAQGQEAPVSAQAEGEASFDNGAWQYGWYLGRDPDEETFNVTAIITDVAGRLDQTTRAVTVDTALPAPFTVTLSYINSLGDPVPLQPGQTIRDRSFQARLWLDWTASSDGSGLTHYWAGWTTSPEPDPAQLTRYGAGTFHHEQDVGDLQVVYAHVAAEDGHGNRRWYTLGPVYVDFYTTPDLFPLAATGPVYHGWMDGASQLGADRALQHNFLYGQLITGTQRFYASWDLDTLRLAWTGADWNNDGDLFIYFDTLPGGSPLAYNPYPATPDTIITLPKQGGSPMPADYMVWVQDETTADLWQWDGAAWVLVHPLAGYYRLDTSLNPPYTDLSLPRDWLSLGPTATLNMVALASEEGALRLWAAMPERNPLNSELANNLFPPVGVPYFALEQQYGWSSLLLGVRPNEGQFADSDLRVRVTSSPAGLQASFPETDLYTMSTWRNLDADLDGVPDADLNRESSPGLVGQGQVISYTVYYTNEGTAAAPGVMFVATAFGALDLEGGSPALIWLGDVPAGASGVATFSGTVNTSVYTRSLEVDMVVQDGVHGHYEWFWVQHDVDSEPPQELAIVAPRTYARPFVNTVRGTVVDASPVPSIVLDGVGPGGPMPLTYCIDETPEDGNWVCSWDVGPANDGDQFLLRAQASDVYGNTSAWTGWVTLTVDAYPPSITLSAESELALQGAELGPGDSLLLTGEVEDDREADAAEFCTGSGAGQSCEEVQVLPGDQVTGTWRYLLQPAIGLDHEPMEFHLHGLDGAGNYSPPLTRTCLVDTVPPAVVITYRRGVVPVGVPMQVLAGTVSDGSGSSELYLVITAPDGSVAAEPIVPSGGNWSYTFSAAVSGLYTMQVEARDPQGNTRAYGPFSVFAGVRVYLPLVLKGW